MQELKVIGVEEGALLVASDEGAQLLQFLGAALGAMLRRWATTS